jgi:hypothetical protein
MKVKIYRSLIGEFEAFFLFARFMKKHYYIIIIGGMAEWFKAAVLKTASQKWDVGSNPTPSAMT